MSEVDGRVAVITGGASGIGFGIAQAMHGAGARVVIADISLEDARSAAAEVDGFAVQVDVGDASSVDALLQAVLSHHGEVDILVNNAGVGPQARIADMTLADWHWLIDVNLWGVIHGVTAFLPALLARPNGAHVVNVASMSAFDPISPLGGYAVTKTGIMALTEVLAAELLESGSAVHATVVAPGPVHSRIADSLRHRPDGSAGSLTSLEIDPPPEQWRDPLDVGQFVMQAVRENRLYAITHPELWPRLARRHETLRAAFGADAAE
jgi:NAD(P)-dependent dehydrogenase (short-subunit alcohol dehydrogenase family)